MILISGFTDTLGFDEATTGADIVLQKSANEVSSVDSGREPPAAQATGAAKKPAASQARFENGQAQDALAARENFNPLAAPGPMLNRDETEAPLDFGRRHLTLVFVKAAQKVANRRPL